MRRSLLLVLGCALALGACAAADDEASASSEDALGTCGKAVTNAALNLRAEPNATARLLVTLDAGVTVDVIENGAATGWAHVRSNGVEGFAKASFLACSEARPTFEARHVDDAAITIDGAIDPVWATTPPTTFDTDWSGKPTRSQTTVRALWSEHALYMLWEIDGTGLNTDKSRPISTERENLYTEDCVEIFFTPDPTQPKKYFEIELGPFGHYFDLAIDRKASTSDIHWSSGAVIKTTTDAASHHAVIEVALKSPDIVRVLKSGAALPINMFRMEGIGTREYLAWSPTKTPRPNFHVPEAFGSLHLE